MTNKQLNEWFGRQPFDIVSKITGINPNQYKEAEDIAEGSDEASVDEALAEANNEWKTKSYNQKLSLFEQYDNGW